MKQNKKTIIYLIAGIIIVIIVIVSGIVSNNYLSKVIISQPFSVIIERVSPEDIKEIKIYGYSPTGKIQILNKTKDLNTWNYFDYSNFESLYVFIPDSVKNFSKIIITTNSKLIKVTDLKNKISNTSIDLTKSLEGKFSKTEIIFSMFHWKESNYIMVLCFATVILILFFSIFKKKISALILILNKNKTARYSSIILLCIFVLGIIVHVMFILITKNYLITSGLFLYILMSFFIYFAFVAIGKNTKIRLKIKEIKLTIITLSLCFCLVEILLILTGYTSTNFEKKYENYSPGNNANNINHYWVYKMDHYLKTSEFSYFRKTNSEGMSDIEHAISKKKNEFRIIGLGDSFTEGDGSDVDSTWLKFLERNLSKYPIKKELTFINAGICGSDPIWEYDLLKEKLLKYNPDLIMVAVNSTDIGEIASRGGMERFLPDGSIKFKEGPWWEPIYAVSHISRLFFNAFGYEKFLYFSTDKDICESKTKIVNTISAFKELSLKNHFKLIVIFHPFREEINSNELKLKTEMSVSINNKIEVFDMLHYFSEKEKISSTNSGDYFWKHDGHHNAKGYEAFARGVEWKLKEAGIIDSLIKE